MEAEQHVLDTVPGEISFFRSITRFRPVGVHRFFHVLSMQQTIKREIGVDVPFDSIWAKLEACYDLDALEGLEIDGYDSTDSDASQAHSIPSPVPEENLMGHPHFRSEFQLPWEDYDPLMAPRRISETSPPASPVILTRRTGKGKVATSDKTPSRRGSLMAGLVGGDSDSSALTESGDEPMEVDIGTASARQSRRNSATGTPTEVTAEDDEEPEAAGSPASTRGRRGRRRGTPASRRPTTTNRRTRRR